jgi:tRNA pseudouridine55 synthase
MPVVYHTNRGSSISFPLLLPPEIAEPAIKRLVISFRFFGILMVMDTMFLVDKPRGLTSSQVVQRIKKKFNAKAGHTGTLDPLATGLLVVLTGKRTKNASLFLKLDKAYEVKAVLGMETDTFDSDGKILRQNDNEVTREELERAMKEFHGDIWQIPPPFSAKKLAGQKAYQLARKGISVEIPPKKVSIYSLGLKEFQFPHFTLTCEVSSGFYVRSLVHDIGEKLSVGATVLEVRRTRVGPYQIEQAKSLEELLGYE